MKPQRTVRTSRSTVVGLLTGVVTVSALLLGVGGVTAATTTADTLTTTALTTTEVGPTAVTTTTVPVATTTSATGQPGTTTRTTTRTTTTTRTYCDPAPPRGEFVSATSTSLTFSYTSYGSVCGRTDPTQVVVGTAPNGPGVASAYGSASSGTIVVTGLTPGTWYYFVVRGGGSPFSNSWTGPVNTLAEGTGTVSPSPCTLPPAGGLTMSRLAVPEGYLQPQVTAIGNSGVVIGSALTPAGQRHALRWDRTGVVTDLGGLPEGTGSWASDINDRGVIAGSAYVASTETHAVTWSPGGQITDLGTLPGGTGSTAIGIARDGTVLGNATDAAGRNRAVAWNPRGRIRVLDLAGGTSSRASQSNEAGMVVGSITGPSDTDVVASTRVLWDSRGRAHRITVDPQLGYFSVAALNNRGTVTGSSPALTWSVRTGVRLLPMPEGETAHPEDINDTGTVVGTRWSGTSQVLRWDAAGTLTVLALPAGATSGSARAVNNAGAVLGSVTLGIAQHGVIWDGDGPPTDLGGVTTCDTSNPTAMNERGDVIGTVRLSGRLATVPVVWRKG
ncbi:MAG: hypothetical protein GXX79_09205 [Actinomycetales bacterium]|nr:hypothetical protein [Actinomycetales bacterium]